MTDSQRIDTILEDATGRLSDVSDSARLDAELLLAQAIDVSRTYLFAHPEDSLDDLALERFEKFLARRIAGEPLAYIHGTREFWSLVLMVTPATLVPRPETELLVDLALREIPRNAEWSILDLGTGSGAIAVAIARERKSCHIAATDISEDALAVARQNARQLELPDIEFLCGDWTEPVRDRKFDVIVSNPPYVSASDAALDALAAEPRAALVAGEDGLDAIRVLARDCKALLQENGVFLFEHGADQAAEVAALLARHGWHDIRCQEDYAGLPRVTIARASPAVPG